jgi:hypothetical protein
MVARNLKSEINVFDIANLDKNRKLVEKLILWKALRVPECPNCGLKMKIGRDEFFCGQKLPRNKKKAIYCQKR